MFRRKNEPITLSTGRVVSFEESGAVVKDDLLAMSDFEFSEYVKLVRPIVVERLREMARPFSDLPCFLKNQVSI